MFINNIKKIVIITFISILISGCESYDNEIPDHKIPNVSTGLPYSVPNNRAQVYIIYLSSGLCMIDCPYSPFASLTLRNQVGINYHLPKPLTNTHFSCLEVKPGEYQLFTEGAFIPINVKQGKTLFIAAKTNIEASTGQPSYDLHQLSFKQGEYYVNKDVVESKKILKTNISWSNEVRYYPSLIKIPKSCQIIN